MLPPTCEKILFANSNIPYQKKSIPFANGTPFADGTPAVCKRDLFFADELFCRWYATTKMTVCKQIYTVRERDNLYFGGFEFAFGMRFFANTM